MIRWLHSLVGFGAGALLVAALSAGGSSAAAQSGTLQNWHVHDCVTGCPYYDSAGVWHQPVGFFPKIFNETTAQYLQDPVACPNATDKAFLPNGQEENQPLRSGVCVNNTTVVHLRSILASDPAPDGWTYLTTTVSQGVAYATYYTLTPLHAS